MGQKYRARTALLVLLALLALVWAGRPRAAAAADDDAALANGLQTLVGHVDAASAALARGDIADARAAYTQFDNGWFDIEDGVRERSRDSYRAIERAMDDVQFGLRPDQPDVAAVQGSLGVLRQQVTAFIATLGAAPTTADAPAPPGAAAPADEATTAARDALRPWAAHVDAALSRLNAGDLAGADREFESFRTAWPDIEDAIRPVSRPHYREIERAMGDARAAFSAQPADAAAVREPLQRLQVATSSFLAGTPLPADANEATTSPSVANATPATLLSLLDQVLAALDRGDVAAARTQLRTFQDVWLDVEGLVMTRSRSVYVDTENRTAEAAAVRFSVSTYTDRDRVMTRPSTSSHTSWKVRNCVRAAATSPRSRAARTWSSKLSRVAGVAFATLGDVVASFASAGSGVPARNELVATWSRWSGSRTAAASAGCALNAARASPMARSISR